MAEASTSTRTLLAWSRSIGQILTGEASQICIYVQKLKRTHIIRHGAWLTFGNLDLHLIKGIPSVHLEEEVHVGHIAIAVETNKMAKVRERLHKLGIKPREDVSLANGAKSGSQVDQVCSHIMRSLFLTNFTEISLRSICS